ncbi:glycosyltransferase family 2 protein [Vulcanisaeta thermophila]|uniref:glycosyltransferase family 2 protein n=1 Tax=Vulcanisaeta thermophila TaxID=867917 RepID=UPI00117D742E|nr:glycosyltransferase family 2 protein [Vulcanisaeta thermophila]
MRTSVVVITYRRAWSLPYLLNGLMEQTVKPDEVVIVLKPSGDGSEKVIERYREHLNIRLVIQDRDFAPRAYTLGIREASGDLVLFIDDDAVPRRDWVERYVRLFNELKDAGAIGGLTYKAYLVNGSLMLTRDSLFGNEETKAVFYRKPLSELSDYCRWLSVSGYPGSKKCDGPLIRSVLLNGTNMGFRRDLIMNIDLEKEHFSKRAFHFEAFLAYYVVKRGFNSYHVIDESMAPIAWHIESHRESLTRRGGFWGEFWLQFDRASMFFRLRRLGAGVSPLAYLAANLAVMRRGTVPRLLGTIYAIILNSL